MLLACLLVGVESKIKWAIHNYAVVDRLKTREESIASYTSTRTGLGTHLVLSSTRNWWVMFVTEATNQLAVACKLHSVTTRWHVNNCKVHSIICVINRAQGYLINAMCVRMWCVLQLLSTLWKEFPALHDQFKNSGYTEQQFNPKSSGSSKYVHLCVTE